MSDRSSDHSGAADRPKRSDPAPSVAGDLPESIADRCFALWFEPPGGDRAAARQDLEREFPEHTTALRRVWQQLERSGRALDRVARDPDAPEVVAATRALEKFLDSLSATGASAVFAQEHGSSAARDGDGGGAANAKYLVGSEIGAGGVGQVFRGVDQQLGREVALKFLRAGARPSAAAITRFVDEAQIGGQLEHPGIVPVHDVGVVDGAPFFAMAIVRGVSLAERLKERADPVESRASFVSIFASVCQTVAYAHARGVVHRDLKPSNVMVGAFGDVKVMDWGLAKVTDQDDSGDETSAAAGREPLAREVDDLKLPPKTLRANTATGSKSIDGTVLGTPAYMPPEQAAGAVGHADPRGDTFALGGMLFEILTGQPPYGGGSATEVLAKARAAELSHVPVRLDAAKVPVELASICVDCLQKCRQDRPADAGVVAERIVGYLSKVEQRAEGLKIEAATANLRADAARRSRRQARVLAAVVCLFSLFAAGGFGWWTHERQVLRAQADSQIRDRLASARASRDHQDLQKALVAVDSALALGSIDAASASLVAEAMQLHADLEQAAAAVAQERARRARDEQLARQLGSVRQPVGQGTSEKYTPKIVWSGTRRLYAKAFVEAGVPLHEGSVAEAVAAFRDADLPASIVPHIDRWAAVCLNSKARGQAARLKAIASQLDGHPLRRELRSIDLKNEAPRLLEVAARDDLPSMDRWTLELLGRRLLEGRARATGLRVLRMAQELHRDDFAINVGLARALVFQRPPHGEEAARYFEAALALRPNNEQALHEYGIVLQEHLNDPERAVGEFERAVNGNQRDLHLRLHLADACNAAGNYERAQRVAIAGLKQDPVDPELLRVLATAQFELGNHDEAIATRRKLCKLQDDWSSYSDLGAALQSAHKPKEARAAFEQSLQRTQTLPVLVLLSDLLIGEGDLPAAITLLQEARETLASAPSSSAHLVSKAHSNLGTALARQGDIDGALQAHLAAVDADPEHALAWLNLAATRLHREEFDEAVTALTRSSRLGTLAAKYRPHGRRFLLTALSRKAQKLMQEGDLASAIATAHEAVRAVPRNHDSWFNLGTLYKRDGKHRAAERAFRRLTQLDEANPDAWCELGFALQAQDKHAEAVVSFAQGHQLGQKRADWKKPSAEWLAKARALARDKDQ